MKLKLKKIAEDRLKAPSPELIIRKMKDKVNSKLLEHASSLKSLKGTIIRQDNEPSFQVDIKKLGFLQQQQKQRQYFESTNAKGLLNIPYYRKIMKVPLAQLKNELESLQINTPEQTQTREHNKQNIYQIKNGANGFSSEIMKNPMLNQKLTMKYSIIETNLRKNDKSSSFLPSITSPNHNAFVEQDHNMSQLKASVSMGSLIQNQKSRQTQQNKNPSIQNINSLQIQRYPSITQQNSLTNLQSFLVAGAHIKGLANEEQQDTSVDNSFDFLNQSKLMKKAIIQQVLGKPMFKLKRNQSQEHSIDTTQEDIQKLYISNTNKDQSKLMQKINSLPMLDVLPKKKNKSRKRITMRSSVLSVNNKYQSQQQQQSTNTTIINQELPQQLRQNQISGLYINNVQRNKNHSNQMQKSLLDDSRLKSVKQIPSVANLLKALNL
eukprot:403373147